MKPYEQIQLQVLQELLVDSFQDLFESLDIPIIAFYMLTYSTQKPGANYSINLAIGAGQSQYPSANPSTSEIVSNYTAEATQGVTYRISVGAVAVACQSLFGQPGSASASISGLGLNLSLAIRTIYPFLLQF